MGPSAKLQATRYPNLFLRGRMYYFRMTLPASTEGKRHDICVSLATSDPTYAKMLAGNIKSLYLRYMSQGKPELSNPAIRTRLRDIARDYCQREIEKLNENIELGGFNPLLMATETREFIQEQTQRLQHGSYPGHIAADAVELLEQELPEASKDLEIQRNLRAMLLRAEIEAQRVFLRKVSADFTSPDFQDTLFLGLDPDAIRPIPELDEETGKLVYPGETPSIKRQTLEEAIEDYLALKKSQRKDEKTVEDIALSLRAFKLVRPDIKRINELNKAAISDFEVRLSHLPAKFSIRKELRGMNYEQIKVAGANLPKFSASSFDKYMLNVRTFVNWCQETDRIPADWKLPKYNLRDTTSAKFKRDPFTDDEIQKMFTSPQYTGHEPNTPGNHLQRHVKGKLTIKDYLYWVPLVSLYSGMRLGEIVQLQVADIKSEKGIPYMDVNDEGDKRIKNASSRRKVPIHPELVRMGFLDLVAKAKKDGNARVFSESPHSDECSRKFGRYFEHIGIKHKKLTFHSLRHTFIDWTHKRVKLNDHIIKAIVGHCEETVTFGTYGGEYTVAELHQEICKLRYPLTL